MKFLLLAWLALFNVVVFGQERTFQNKAIEKSALQSNNAVELDSVFKLSISQGSSHVFDRKSAVRPMTIPTRAGQATKFNAVSVTKADFPVLVKNAQRTLHTDEICYVFSGRDFLNQDSILLYGGDPILAADGNVILSGEYADYSMSPLKSGGFCMKTDIGGNMIWGKLYDSTGNNGFDFLNLFRSLELRNGDILLAGRTSNYVSGNNDFLLMRLDPNGNMTWQKTYESRVWQGFNGSGDYFYLTDLEEDPQTGDLYFVGTHFFGYSTVTQVDPDDGQVRWSNAYETYASESAFGIVINPGNLFLFQVEFTNYNYSYLSAIAINKTNGDTLYSKHLFKTGDPNDAQMYRATEVVRLNNGHFRMCGVTTRFFEYPVFTGTKDLYHAAIVELDEQFNFVNGWGFKNRVESNASNTRVSLYPDGSGVFTMLRYISPYTAEVEVSLFRNQQIYHQRRRFHNNEGIPYEPRTLQMADGGFLNIKLMGDSTKLGTDGSRLDYYRIHTSDTASLCLGLPDTANSIFYFNYEPTRSVFDRVEKDLFRWGRPKKYNTHNFTSHQDPSCVIRSNCDTLALTTSASNICQGSSVTLNVHKNMACGSLVPFAYDSNFVGGVSKINDSAYQFYFNKPGSGYIHASLMGCRLREDSVFITVLPVRNTLDLGSDTVLCPGNEIRLNAGVGFSTYQWQDGSTDSMFTVTAPGKYYVSAVNSCGNNLSDTVVVTAHPPIPLSIGVDRTKCNNDTLHLEATPGFLQYSWASDYNISSLNGPSVIINPLQDTSYSVIAEKSPGCFAYDTVRISVFHSPAILLGSDTSFCRGQSLVLNAGNTFTNYSWSTGESSAQILVDQPGTYIVSATTAQGCLSSDTLNVLMLYDLPQPDLGPDSVLCAGSSRLLHTTGQYATYTWSNTEQTSQILVNQPGNYWLTVTDSHGCKGSDSTLIPGIVDLPAAYLGKDTGICSYSTLVLQPNAAFQRYLWSNGSFAKSIQISQPGTYWLEVTDQNNCRGSDTIVVSKKDCMEGLYVPTAFTPNGDGKNDILRPLVFGDIISFTFRMYNRWGELVFETKTPGEGWDGSFQGQPQDSHLFIWVCTYQLNGQPPKMQKGTAILIR